MASGTYQYEDDDTDLSFEIEWTAPGVSSSQEAQHERLLAATAEKTAEYLQDALDIGDHWKPENVELRLSNWYTPMCRVWLRGPPGHLTEDSDDPDAAEAVRQRKEFYQNHNAVYDERLYVDGQFFDIKIDVRQF